MFRPMRCVSKNSRFRLRVDFENEPIMKAEVTGIKGLKDAFKSLKDKLG